MGARYFRLDFQCISHSFFYTSFSLSPALRHNLYEEEHNARFVA